MNTRVFSLLLTVGLLVAFGVLQDVHLARVVADTCTSSGSPGVTTDKLDYEPGETVFITGEGFDCGAGLTVTVTWPPEDGRVDSAAVVAGGDGTFTYNYELGLDAISGAYTVDVLDTDGNVLASTVFYDTHFRFGHITWKQVAGNTVEFEFIVGFRRSFPFPCRNANLGDVCSFGGSGRLRFGDGASVTPNYTIIGVDVANDWLLGRASVQHTYPGPGPFTVFNATCCRISPPRHINNPNRFWRVEAIVNLNGGNTGNPKSLLPPIVDCPQDAVCRFTVAASDPDGHTIRFSKTSPASAWGSSNLKHPGEPGSGAPNLATIDPNTGIYSWDTTGATLNAGGETLYSTQVTIEDLDAQGNVTSKSAIDFFIRLVEPTEEPTTEVIEVPVMWCALEGSPSVEDPDGQGGSSTTDILKRRLQDVSDKIYLANKAQLIFRSAVPEGVFFEVFGDGVGDDDGKVEAGEIGWNQFPVIRDPTRPTDDPKGPGKLGDVAGAKEWNDAAQNCTAVWEFALEAAGLSGNPGIVAVNIRDFVESDGTSSGILGMGGTDSSNTGLLGGLVMRDEKLGDTGRHIIGHELGHALSLHHGNGINEDGDGDLDEDTEFTRKLKIVCVGVKSIPGNEEGVDDDNDGSIDEDGPEDTRNLMLNCYISNLLGGFLLRGTKLTVDESNLGDPNTQVGKIRTYAATPFVGDSILDAVLELPAAEALVDLSRVGIGVDQRGGVIVFSARASGPLSSAVDAGQTVLNYFFLLDLDNDPATGASSTVIGDEIGTPTTFQGAEFIFQAQVDVSGDNPQATPVVKQFQAGAFVQVVDPSIQARVGETVLEVLFESESSTGLKPIPQAFVELELDSALVGQIATPRFTGIAHDPNTGTVDTSDEKTASFVQPTFARCQVSPSSVVLGSVVTVDASGLPPNGTAELFLGSDLVATDPIDGLGDASIRFAIPEDTQTGNRLVTVGAQGTAITADCTLFLEAAPEFHVPPTPELGSTLTVAVGDTLTFDVEAFDRDAGDVVSLDVIGAPLVLGATFSSTPGNPATGSFSWTPGAGDVGIHPVTFTAIDDTGRSAPPHTIFIEVVANRPPIADANGRYEAKEGGIITLDGSGSSDPDGDPLSFEWEFQGESFFDVFADISMPDDFSGIATLTVDDGQGATDTDTATVAFINVPPAVDAGPDHQIFSGDTVTKEITFSDPGVNDAPWAYSIDWGLSTSTMGTTTDQSVSITADHQYFVPAEYTVEVCITDKDGGVGCDIQVVTVSPVAVAIDIKPGSDPNSINPDGKGRIPVALLSAADFDAPTSVDRESVTFGPTGQESSMHRRGKKDVPNCGAEDVNSDGLLDLVCHFKTHDAGFQEGDAEGVLRGQTVVGVHIEGGDSVRVVPPQKP